MAIRKFTRKVQDRFVDVLAETASPKRAAEVVGVSRRLAFEYKQKDAEFRTRWDAAIELAMERLLEESFRRAVEGVEEPVVYQGKLATRADPESGAESPLTVTRYSDRLLEVLLKFRFPDQMSDRLRADVNVAGTGLDPQALLRMPASDRSALTLLLTKYKEANNEATPCS